MRLLTIFVVLLLFSCKNENSKDVAILKNEQITKPDYNLKVYNFESLRLLLETDSDSTYVINFWATWCAPCVKELPFFEKINADYSKEKVKVILVSLDFPKKYDSNLIPFIKKNELKSSVIALNDPDGNVWIPKVNKDWSGSIPATLIYNKNKRQFYEQSFSYDELEKEVKQLLK